MPLSQYIKILDYTSMHINGLDFDNPATQESWFKGFPLLNRKKLKLKLKKF